MSKKIFRADYELTRQTALNLKKRGNIPHQINKKNIRIPAAPPPYPLHGFIVPFFVLLKLCVSDHIESRCMHVKSNENARKTVRKE